jgi:hypothetical protein
LNNGTAAKPWGYQLVMGLVQLSSILGWSRPYMAFATSGRIPMGAERVYVKRLKIDNEAVTLRWTL